LIKTQLLVVVVCVTLVNTFVFTVMSGCGILQGVPLALGWHVVSICRGAFFADNHAHVVAAVSALLGACFLAGFLGLVALTARKRGHLASRASLAKMFTIGAVIYLVLSLLPIPIGPCF
jgi:hypothetical protein